MWEAVRREPWQEAGLTKGKGAITCMAHFEGMVQWQKWPSKKKQGTKVSWSQAAEYVLVSPRGHGIMTKLGQASNQLHRKAKPMGLSLKP